MAILSVSAPYNGFQRRPESNVLRRFVRDEEFANYILAQQTLTTTDDEAMQRLAQLKLQAQFGVELQQVDRRSSSREHIPPAVFGKQRAYDHSDIDHLIDLQNARSLDVAS